MKPHRGRPVNPGSMGLAGNTLAFHAPSGDSCTVTYTVNTVAEELDNIELEEDEDEKGG